MSVLNHAEYQRRKRARRKARGQCQRCGRAKSQGQACACYALSAGSRKAWLARNRVQKRLEVLNHYGNMCACCGEVEARFLQIDHIDGGGYLHRKSDPSAINLATWLVKHNFPEGFQLLCANCNHAKRFGVCPHQKSGSPPKDTLVSLYTEPTQ